MRDNGVAIEELRAIRARCDAATRGPWRAFIEDRDHESGSDFIMTGGPQDRGPDLEISGATRADLDFIAHARQDIPRLLDLIATLSKTR